MKPLSSQDSPAPESRERDLFIRALEIDPDARPAWLEAECQGDAVLRARIEELLREEESMGTFLETPALGGTTSGIEGDPGSRRAGGGFEIAEKPGDKIGPYKLLQQIGEGGCGVVYMAEQEKPVRRRVALKVIKLGMDTKSVIARFEAERQALAMMDHPNIAKVLDAGATETGRPYFVMELVRGIRITDYCDQNQLSARERLELFITLCHAIHHAHQKGIIHRDIKPSNVLVTLHDGIPVPKVIDFGIAKATDQRLTDKTLFTEFQAFIGTPAYMSPEQAEMSGLDIDTRGDIYSLGVLLYQLLTGYTPFDAETLFNAGIDECRRTIREQEPPRPSNRVATLLAADLTTTARQRRVEPSRLVQLLRGDLDWVVMKCLEKDRTRRYASAHELASDVRRYLANEPVEARSPSTLYRFRKLVRRQRGAFAAGVAITLILVLGTVISTTMAIRAKRAEVTATLAQRLEASLRQQAERERAAARVNEYVADINLAHQSFLAGNLGRAAQLVEKHRPKSGDADLRGFEWRYLWQLCQGSDHVSLPFREGMIHAVLFSPSGDWVAVAGREKITIWDVAARKVLATLPHEAFSLAALPDGEALLASGRFGLRVWSTQDWTEKAHFPEENGPISVARDGYHVSVTAWELWREPHALILDARTWEPVRKIPGVRRASLSPDGAQLAGEWRESAPRRGPSLPDGAGAGEPREGLLEGIFLWDVATGARGKMLENAGGAALRPWMGPFARLHLVVFSPDGKWIGATDPSVSAHGDFRVRIWDAVSGAELGTIPADPEAQGHAAAITSLDVSPDGKVLVTGSWDHSIRLWDMESGQELALLQGHLSEVWAVSFSGNGQQIVSGSKEGGLKIWPVRQEKKEAVLAGPWHPLGISKDSRFLATFHQGSLRGDESGSKFVTLFNLATREPEDRIRLEVSRRPRGFPLYAMSADSRTFAHSIEDGMVMLVDVPTHETSTLKTGEDRLDLLSLSHDGRMLITGRRDRFPRLWDLRRNTQDMLPVEAHRALFSPDNRSLATFSRDEGIQVWDLQTKALRFHLTARDQQLADLAESFSAAFSADGTLLAVGSPDNAVRLWNAKTGEFVAICSGHKQGVLFLAFSPDGKTLATSSDDGTIKFWSLQTFQELLTLRGKTGPLLFSPDGRWMISGGSVFMPDAKLVFYPAPGFEITDVERKGL